MKLRIHYLVLLITMFHIARSEASCPEFGVALEQAMVRAISPETTIAAAARRAAKWNTVEANRYKELYGISSSRSSDNRRFMAQITRDQKRGDSNVLYFDVENAIQKKLNDTLVGDKGMVDAINNSFMAKFNSHLKADPALSSRLEGQYQDYKSLRLRLKLQPGDNLADYEKRLSEVYAKSNKEFVEEFEKGGLTKLIPPRTDEVVDVSTWFLSGVGHTALEANMATRGARSMGFSSGKATTMSFKSQMANIHADVISIESIRKNLAAQDALLKSGMMIKTLTGEVIPSKDMIGVLRKTKVSDCENITEYNSKIRAQVKKLFNTNISNRNIQWFSSYFSKVDSISPPLFQAERVAIDLGRAKNGIVSVDFAGVGVDNAYEQMRALSAVNYAQRDQAKLLDDAFTRVQNNVDNVTEEMNGAKVTFSKSTNDRTPTQYSGDDGILMPRKNWEMTKKQELIKNLAGSGDPGKYRVTFVRTEFTDGTTIPSWQRSQFVVRAEGIEKSIRAEVVGVFKIPVERARKMIISIDSIPSITGVKYNLIIGGEKPTVQEMKMIQAAFHNSMNKEKGEVTDAIFGAFN